MATISPAQSLGSSFMPGSSNDVARYQRYAEILEVIAAQDAFTTSEVRETCASETPQFVTRVIHELEKDGYLERLGPKTQPSFRWRGDRGDFSGSHWLDGKIYGQRLTRTPAGDRPRERLLAHGAAALHTAELIAILVRSGRPGERRARPLRAPRGVAPRSPRRRPRPTDPTRSPDRARSHRR